MVDRVDAEFIAWVREIRRLVVSSPSFPTRMKTSMHTLHLTHAQVPGQLEIHKLQPKDICPSHFMVSGGRRRNPAVSRRTGYAIRKCQAGGQ